MIYCAVFKENFYFRQKSHQWASRFKTKKANPLSVGENTITINKVLGLIKETVGQSNIQCLEFLFFLRAES